MTEVFEAPLEKVGVDRVVPSVQEVDLGIHVKRARSTEDPFLEEALDEVRTASEQL